jgi:hypothetical protein
VIICPLCRQRNEDGTPTCRGCGNNLAAPSEKTRPPDPPVVLEPSPLEHPSVKSRIAEEVQLVEARFNHEVASLRAALETANKHLAEAVTHNGKAQDASTEQDRVVEARVAEEVGRAQRLLASEIETLQNALAEARADLAAKGLALGETPRTPPRSNGLVFLSGAIGLLAVALLLFVFRPHRDDQWLNRPVRYQQLEKQLSDAHDAANGYQVRIAALEDRVAALGARLKTDDTHVAALRSELAEAQSRPSVSSPSQAATIRSLRIDLAAEKDQLAGARSAFVNVQHSRDEALAELARLEGR